ncbi:uncharacterized protein LOC108680197 [Hyalella azteca]|uniref:Uncharacterized protein LOC108680197 n=1 Tax=Hyalella azteca TaxID=294128 RepID=A0A8B7PE95_HYAAZ|nr:uncharacterized protein LOC108680197 [Hyalella azteca]
MENAALMEHMEHSNTHAPYGTVPTPSEIVPPYYGTIVPQVGREAIEWDFLKHGTYEFDERDELGRRRFSDRNLESERLKLIKLNAEKEQDTLRVKNIDTNADDETNEARACDGCKTKCKVSTCGESSSDVKFINEIKNDRNVPRYTREIEKDDNEGKVIQIDEKSAREAVERNGERKDTTQERSMVQVGSGCKKFEKFDKKARNEVDFVQRSSRENLLRSFSRETSVGSVDAVEKSEEDLGGCITQGWVPVARARMWRRTSTSSVRMEAGGGSPEGSKPPGEDGPQALVLGLLTECNALEQQISELMEDNSRLEGTSVVQARQLTEIRRLAADRQREITRLQQVIQQANDNNKSLTLELQQASAECSYLKAEIEQANVKIQLKNEENEMICQANQQAVKKLMLAIKEKNNLEEKLNVLVEEKLNLEHKLNCFDAEMEETRKESAHTKEDVDVIVMETTYGTSTGPSDGVNNPPQSASAVTLACEAPANGSIEDPNIGRAGHLSLEVTPKPPNNSSHAIPDADEEDLPILPSCAATATAGFDFAAAFTKTGDLDHECPMTAGDADDEERRISRPEGAIGGDASVAPTAQEAVEWTEKLSAIKAECERLVREGRQLQHCNAALQQQVEALAEERAELQEALKQSTVRLRDALNERSRLAQTAARVVWGVRGWSQGATRLLSVLQETGEQTTPLKHRLLVNTERRLLIERNAALQSANWELLQLLRSRQNRTSPENKNIERTLLTSKPHQEAHVNTHLPEKGCLNLNDFERKLCFEMHDERDNISVNNETSSRVSAENGADVVNDTVNIQENVMFPHGLKNEDDAIVQQETYMLC